MRHHLARGCTALALAAIAWLAAAAWFSLDGYPWPEGSALASDGTTHRLDVAAGTELDLWSDEATAAPRCTATDAATGADLPITENEDPAYRSAGVGAIGAWTASQRVEAGNGALDLTCDSREGPGQRVLVAPAPTLLSVLDPRAPTAWSAGAALLLLTVGLFVACAIAFGRREQRRPAPPR